MHLQNTRAKLGSGLAFAVVILLGLIPGAAADPGAPTPTATTSAAGSQPASGKDLPSSAPNAADRTIPALATRTSNTVLNADGSYTAEISEEPVNFRDQGEWRPISNELVEAPGAVYSVTNEANAYNVSLPENASTDPVKFAVDGSWIKVQSHGLADSPPQVDGSEATYDSDAGTDDVTYEVTNSGLKETIRLDSAPVSFLAYTYDLKMSAGITPSLLDSGGVAFTLPTGEVPFGIPAPFMYDSAATNPTYSTAVRYELIGGGSNYQLKVVPNRDWLASPERVFPVFLDPSLDTYPPKDCWMQESTPNTSRCEAQLIWAGLDNANGSRRRGLLDFRIDAVPTDATIQSSVAYLYKDGASGAGNATASYGLYQPAYDWSKSATWSNSGTGFGWTGGSPQGLRSNLVSIPVAGSGYQAWDVSQFVNYWRTGSLPNRGMLLKQNDETKSGAIAFIGHSQNNGQQPILRITYTRPSPPPAPIAPSATTPTISPWLPATSLTSTTPVLSSVISDPDSSVVAGDIHILDLNGNDLWSGRTAVVSPGQPVSVSVPPGIINPGQVYSTTIAPADETQYGAYSAPRYFNVGECQDFDVCPDLPRGPGYFDVTPVTVATASIPAQQTVSVPLSSIGYDWDDIDNVVGTIKVTGWDQSTAGEVVLPTEQGTTTPGVSWSAVSSSADGVKRPLSFTATDNVSILVRNTSSSRVSVNIRAVGAYMFESSLDDVAEYGIDGISDTFAFPLFQQGADEIDTLDRQTFPDRYKTCPQWSGSATSLPPVPPKLSSCTVFGAPPNLGPAIPAVADLPSTPAVPRPGVENRPGPGGLNTTNDTHNCPTPERSDSTWDYSRYTMCSARGFYYIELLGNRPIGYQHFVLYRSYAMDPKNVDISVSTRLEYLDCAGESCEKRFTYQITVSCEGVYCGPPLTFEQTASDTNKKPAAREFDFTGTLYSPNTMIDHRIRTELKNLTTGATDGYDPDDSLLIRCDNLSYFNQSPGCTVPAYEPIFKLSRTDPKVDDSAKFIAGVQAMDPQWGVEGDLSRSLTRTTREMARKNRHHACKNFPGKTMSCDEYPFASTEQGCYEGGTPSNCKRDDIDKLKNTTAGSFLGTFYQSQRIKRKVSDEQFYVRII